MDKGICNGDRLPANQSLPKIAPHPTEQHQRRHEDLEWEHNKETTENCTRSMTGRIRATTTNPNEIPY